MAWNNFITVVENKIDCYSYMYVTSYVYMYNTQLASYVAIATWINVLANKRYPITKLSEGKAC